MIDQGVSPGQSGQHEDGADRPTIGRGIGLVVENRIEILLTLAILHMTGWLTTASETVGGMC